MQIIKLDAIDSTNLYLKELSRKESLKDFTVVMANEQYGGRGQMGAEWLTEKGKNLTFSVLKKFQQFAIHEQFLISICTSLAVYDCLNDLKVPDVKVKWPNDIMSGSSKISGILVENIIKGDLIGSSIIGIGLNVNQTHFADLNKVGSLKTLTGRDFDLEGLLETIIKKMDRYFQQITNFEGAKLRAAYEAALFRKNEPSKFENLEGKKFLGTISGISKTGKLLVILEEGQMKEFGLKELKLLY